MKTSATALPSIFYPSDPTLLLTVAFGLFVAPVLYMVVAAWLHQQGGLTPYLSPDVRVAVVALGAAQLLYAAAIPRLMRSMAETVRFVMILAVTTSAPVFGFILAFAGGGRKPLTVLSIAAMVATLYWSWRHRACFRSRPLEHVVTAYTIGLIFSGVLGVGVVVLRLLFTGDVQPAPFVAFATFMNVVVALGAFGAVVLRRRGSTYALPATRVVSFAHLYALPFGPVVFLLWLIWVRPREKAVQEDLT